MTAATGNETKEKRSPTVSGFAIVGFIALIIAGMFLIVYAANFIPQALSRLAGSVYLSPEEPVNPEPEDETPIIIIPDNEPEEPAATTTPSRPTTPVVQPVPQPVLVPAPLYGNPDLRPEILAVGRLAGNSTNSFVADQSIDENDIPAIRFRVRNVGTNQITFWQVDVHYPTEDTQDTYRITSYDLLRPGGYKDFTFGFDNPDVGNDRRFEVVVDPTNGVREVSESNNRATATIDVDGDDYDDRDDDLWCELEADDTRIDEGDSTRLRWETDGDVRYASINHGIGRVDEDGGSERVSPDEDTTYRLTIENRDGDEETCSVTVRVDED